MAARNGGVRVAWLRCFTQPPTSAPIYIQLIGQQVAHSKHDHPNHDRVTPIPKPPPSYVRQMKLNPGTGTRTRQEDRLFS